MSKLIRTSITLPADLYEQLRTTSFYQKKPISQLIREGAEKVLRKRKTSTRTVLKKIEGKYAVTGKKGEFGRGQFYDKFIRKKMSY